MLLVKLDNMCVFFISPLNFLPDFRVEMVDPMFSNLLCNELGKALSDDNPVASAVLFDLGLQ